jgi:purine-binding chemotaxis protein CheW
VLPALSLRALLGLPDQLRTGRERVVVIRLGGRSLALVVDQISVILRATRDRVTPAPSLFNRGAGEARIDAVLRMPDGRGLVSILSPERVLADDRVARLLADTQQKDETMATTASAAPRERFIVIRLGQEAYGLPIGAVDEVVRLPDKLTRLPKAPAYVSGVMNLRGRVIPVIDQRRRFAVEGEQARGGRVVVVTLGALQAGFAVDEASEILEVEAADLLPATRHLRRARPCLRPRGDRRARGRGDPDHRSRGPAGPRRGRPAARPDGEFARPRDQASHRR